MKTQTSKTKQILGDKLNITFLVIYFIVFIGLVYMHGQGIEAAAWYGYLALFAVTGIFMLIISLKRADLKAIFDMPIEEEFPQANYNMLVGMGLPAIFAIIFNWRAFIPESVIFSQKVFQLYSQPAFSSFFVRSPVAGVMEELAFGIIFVLIWMMVAFWVMKSVGWDTKGRWTKPTIISVGIAGSILFFAIFHTLNPSYYGSDFIWALVFRAFLNIMIWGLGAFGFAVGYHMINNYVAIGKAFFLPGLFFFIPFIIVLIFSVYVLRNKIDFSLGLMSKLKGKT